MIYCHDWLLDHNQWGRSRSPKMLSIALVIVNTYFPMGLLIELHRKLTKRARTSGETLKDAEQVEYLISLLLRERGRNVTTSTTTYKFSD
jgi:hypothetical protein